MSMPGRTRSLRLLAASLLVGTLLAGCTRQPAATPVDPVTVTSGPSLEMSPPTELGVSIGADPRQLLVTTLGSSSCPTVPVTVIWDAAAQVLEVSLGSSQDGDQPCTADSAQTTSVLQLPPEAPGTAGMTVVIDGREFVVGSS